MTDEHVEREPSPTRKLHKRGDHRFLMAQEPRQLFGPCRRGFLWRISHVEYDADVDMSEVVYRPVADYELDRVPGLRQQLAMFQQHQAMQAGAVSHLTGRTS